MQRLVRESSVTSGVTADVRKLLTALKSPPCPQRARTRMGHPIPLRTLTDNFWCAWRVFAGRVGCVEDLAEFGFAVARDF